MMRMRLILSNRYTLDRLKATAGVTCTQLKLLELQLLTWHNIAKQHLLPVEFVPSPSNITFDKMKLKCLSMQSLDEYGTFSCTL